MYICVHERERESYMTVERGDEKGGHGVKRDKK